MGKTEQIRVLLVEPGEKPRLVNVEHTLENLQKLVGGDIQAVYPWEDNVALVCSDTGKIDGLVANRMLEDYDIICGTFFICGLTTDNFGSISDELAEKYEKKFHYPELFMRTLDGHVLNLKIGSGNPPEIIV